MIMLPYRQCLGVLTGVAVFFSAAASLAETQQPSTQPGSQPPARRLTLPDAIQTALRNNPGLRAVAEKVVQARGALNESRSAMLPTLSAEGSYTHLDKGVTAQLAPGQSITIVKQDQKSATVSAVWPVDIAGLLRAASSVSEFQYLIARLEYNRQRNKLVEDVTTAYFDVLRAHALLTVAERAAENAADRLRVAEAYLNAGTGTKFDVLRAETEVANARQGVLTAQNGVALATAALNNVLGLDQATPLELEPITEAHTSEVKTDLNTSITEAYKVRPEVLQADVGIRAAEKGFYLASRSQLPSLAIVWNQQYTPDTGAFGRKSSWAAVARLTVPIFDAGTGAARRQQAQAQVEAAKLGRQQALDGIALEVRQAYLTYVTATERLKVAEAALAQAEEAYRLAQVRYRAGVTLIPGGSPLLEISDAQTALTQAQTNHVNARYDVVTARTRLERAMGRYAYGADALPGLETPPAGEKK